ncbi:MAG: aminopeptidase [Gemmatimonadota bacterium]
MFAILVGLILFGYTTAYVASEDVRYLTRAGIEETRILQGRRSIADMVADRMTTPEVKASLSLVLQARDFAAALGLEAKETYTTYSDVGRDTLLLVLSASPKNCLCAYLWKYPIVGRIPYKGFFDPRQAQKAADKLERQGYDVYLRPSGAFSTLGWFNDPLLSTAISRDSMELVATVLHEIAHNTLYVKSATPFNEGFAQMVGYYGAEAFFRLRGDTATADRAANRWHDEVVLSGYYAELGRQLDSAYAGTKDTAVVEVSRKAVAAWARSQLEGPIGAQLKTYRIGRLTERPINNAQIIAARIYRTRLELFESWYQQHQERVDSAVAALGQLVNGVPGDSVYTVLARSTNDSAATAH